jgi:hypothetical protein
MANYAGLDADAGYYITEVVFILQLGTWAFARLYIYPFMVVIPAWNCVGPFSSTLVQEWGLKLMCAFLTFLVVLHIWWYFLFCRILYRLVTSESAHDAGREEYEGDSHSEGDDGDEPDNVVTKTKTKTKSKKNK